MKFVSFLPQHKNYHQGSNGMPGGMPYKIWRQGEDTQGLIICSNVPQILQLDYCYCYPYRDSATVCCKDRFEHSYTFLASEWQKVIINCVLTKGSFGGNFIFVKRGTSFSLSLVC